MTEIRPPTLAARLLAVMGEVPYIQKGGKTQSGPSFKYVKHDDVVALVRPALVKHGVGFMTGIDENSVDCVQVGETKSGAARYKTTLVLRLTFMNVDDPSDAYSVSFPGEGVDTDDKGSGKALSYALKNGLLKTFMIESGDEADNESTPQEAAPRPQAVRQDQQREQAATPAPSGNGGGLPITRTQAEQLHAVIFSKGRTDAAVLTILGEHGIGDGLRFGSIPADKFAHVLDQLSKLADPPPPEPTTPAAAPVSAESVSATDFTQPAPAAQEATQEVAASAAASAAPEPPATPEEANAEDGDGFGEFDAELAKAAEAKATPEKAKRKATVTAAQLTRLGAQCADLETQGVGRDEWRLYMMDKEGVSSRTELTKAAATRVIDYLARWIVDLKTGVAGPSEGRAA